jgi:unsaturated rhamnogalacturonyl hydrolase
MRLFLTVFSVVSLLHFSVYAADKQLELKWNESKTTHAAVGDFHPDWFNRSADRNSILLITPYTKGVERWLTPVTNDQQLKTFRLSTLYTYRIDFDSNFPPLDKQPFYLGETPESRGEDPFGDKQIGPSIRAHKHLWRSLGWLAPDLIVIWKPGDSAKIGLPESTPETLQNAFKKFYLPTYILPSTHLASAITMANPPPAGTGTIPAIEFVCSESVLSDVLPAFLNSLHEANLPQISPAHQELLNRRKRTPLEIAKQLDAVYGHDLKKVMYQPALSLVARLNLDDLLGETSRHADVEKIVSAYASGEKPSLEPKPSGSVTAGHLIFSELAHRADKEKYLPLVIKAADQAFDTNGSPLEAMPAHSEMSDAVFMGTPILAAAGRLSGDEKYFQMCLRHVRFMQKLCLRDDGIYRHSPLDEAAWGRGNGFPALGLAWTLSEIPSEHPVHKELVKDLRNHLKALLKHQDPTGMWRQVIDEAGAYREMTATCMITFAILRGLREGWLDEQEFLPAVQAAWPAIQERISANGELIDVCTGTGKQKSLQDYFDRPAILGKDERGGAMAFLVVTEYAHWSQR